MEDPNDRIGNRTRDLPACGAVSQEIPPPRTLTPFPRLVNTVRIKF